MSGKEGRDDASPCTLVIKFPALQAIMTSENPSKRVVGRPIEEEKNESWRKIYG
jgi:hypothetical protein